MAAEAPIELPEETADTACVIAFAVAAAPLLAASPGNVFSSSRHSSPEA